jgi:hypothetical protein
VRRWVVAAAAVTPSLLTRGLVHATQWVAPSPCPFAAFERYVDAEHWLILAAPGQGLAVGGCIALSGAERGDVV